MTRSPVILPETMPKIPRHLPHAGIAVPAFAGIAVSIQQPGNQPATALDGARVQEYTGAVNRENLREPILKSLADRARPVKRRSRAKTRRITSIPRLDRG